MNSSNSTPNAETSPAPAVPSMQIPMDVQELFPPAPLLAGESVRRFMRLWGSVALEMGPRSFSEWVLTRHITEAIWEIERLRRIKMLVINAHVPDAAVASLTPQVTQADLLGVPGEKIKLNVPTREELMADLAREAFIDEAMESRVRLAKICKSLGLTSSTLPALAYVEHLRVVERLDQLLERAERQLHKLQRDFERRRMILAGPGRPRTAETIEEAR